MRNRIKVAWTSGNVSLPKEERDENAVRGKGALGCQTTEHKKNLITPPPKALEPRKLSQGLKNLTIAYAPGKAGRGRGGKVRGGEKIDFSDVNC